jgi:Zn finger protein HypA/HybF involved in hydrogenase expression
MLQATRGKEFRMNIDMSKMDFECDICHKSSLIWNGLIYAAKSQKKYCPTCFYQNFQPERSKREDLKCSKCNSNLTIFEGTESCDTCKEP